MPRGPRAQIAEIRHGAGSVTLTLLPNERWNGFRAGQFVRLTVEVDGVLETRCYSPACEERSGGEIEITVKAHRAGKVSRYLHEHARPGMTVGLSDAEGDFVLPAERPARLLLISSGSGITPVMSILRTLCTERHCGAVTFLHYAPTPSHVVYRQQLAAIAAEQRNVQVVFAYTRETVAGQLAGHISSEHLRRVACDYRRSHTYVCGAPGLIAWVRSRWADEGIERLLRTESFLPPSFATARYSAAAGMVHFSRSDAQVYDDGRSLLEQAEHVGLRPPFGCRIGICRMCTCRKTAGSVRNVLSGEISSPAEEDIQLCVSVPVDNVELAL
ncbi:MAG TPA: ferredoxin reductase [Solirubrobacteraceae bacterium]|nr:ferredoxin reductase [Solirubrobacteraceae bacterium]